MSLELVVVRRPYRPGLRPIRTGSVVGRDGDLHVVRWDDNGVQEEVYLGDYEHAAVRDSVEHMGLTGRLEAVFTADALAVVLRVLADSGTPLNGRQIKAYLLDRGLPKTVWDAGWAKIRQVLPGYQGVECVGDKGTRTFAWAASEDDLPPLPLVAAELSEAEIAAPAPEQAPTPEPTPALEPTSAAAADETADSSDESARSADPAAPESLSSPEEEAAAESPEQGTAAESQEQETAAESPAPEASESEPQPIQQR